VKWFGHPRCGDSRVLERTCGHARFNQGAAGSAPGEGLTLLGPTASRAAPEPPATGACMTPARPLRRLDSMSQNVRVDPTHFLALVEQLGDPVRSKTTFHHLLKAGPAARLAARSGLTHASGDVRLHCVRLVRARWNDLRQEGASRPPVARGESTLALSVR
jgi:hypothetical protein